MPEESIEYKIRKSKRAKRLRLAVYCDGSVVVTSPVDAQLYRIQEYVTEKRRWIYEKLDFFRGVQNDLSRRLSNADYAECKDEAKQLVTRRVEHFMKMYDVTYNVINIKNQKSRWGSCSKKRNLNFNYKIIFLPQEIQDYVIVHEICHLIEFNHSKKFWQLVEKAIPGFNDLKRQLQSFDLNI